MVTIKQMEAVYWVHKLGSFHAAADKLNATQSTISKRVQEFELSFSVPVLDRSKKGVVLSRLGHSLLPKISEILDIHWQIVTLGGENSEYAGVYRFGMTEIVALSWLPDLVATIKSAYPRIILEPQVDLSVPLLQRLEERELDMVIIPRLPSISGFRVHTLGTQEAEWMCSPNLLPAGADIPDDFIARHPLLVHSAGPVMSELLKRELDAANIRVNRTIASNSLLALAELAKAGFGVTFLPTNYFQPMLDRNELRIVKAKPSIRNFEYVAVHREDVNDVLNERIALMAQSVFR